jgi:hypothetical protein
MSEGNQVGVSEAEIAVHWQEEEYLHPSRDFIRQLPGLFQGICGFVDLVQILAYDP